MELLLWMIAFIKKKSNFMSRNIFDYLEFAFKKIFSLDWIKKLQSSFIVGVSCTLLQFILFCWVIAIGFFQFHQITSWYEILPLAITILGIYILVTLTLLLIEKSFYSIVIPQSFYGNNELKGLREVYRLWKQLFWKYMTYVTYYSLAIITLFAIFILGWYIAILLLEEPAMIFIVSIVAIFIYTYANVRLVLAWYSAFFLPPDNSKYLSNSWDLLKWKVWSTFIKTCVFSFIVWTGSGVSTYIAQLFIPDMSEWLLNEIEKLSQLTSTPQIQDIQNMLQIFAGPFLYSLAIFMIFYKFARVLTEAMRHVFLMEYYKDISQTEPNSQEILNS